MRQPKTPQGLFRGLNPKIESLPCNIPQHALVPFLQCQTADTSLSHLCLCPLRQAQSPTRRRYFTLLSSLKTSHCPLKINKSANNQTSGRSVEPNLRGSQKPPLPPASEPGPGPKPLPLFLLLLLLGIKPRTWHTLGSNTL